MKSFGSERRRRTRPSNGTPTNRSPCSGTFRSRYRGRSGVGVKRPNVVEAGADVTVAAGDLGEGTVLWSHPGGGAYVTSLAAAVPSPSGVADVFAVGGGGTVDAITTEGMTAWRASLPSPWAAIVPDFQGGLIANDGLNIVRLDGITGESRTLYTGSEQEGTDSVVVHRTERFLRCNHTTSLPRRWWWGLTGRPGRRSFG